MQSRPNPGGPNRPVAPRPPVLPGGPFHEFPGGGHPRSPLSELSPGQRFNPFRGGGPQHPNPGGPNNSFHPASTVGDGYDGLSGIIAALTHGVNQQQMDRISGGYNGTNGVIGNMNGAFAGLSPYAMHFLGTSGILSQVNHSVPTTDASGNPLTGSALLMANLQNMIGQQAPAQYKLADGITAQDLQTLFSHGIGGHSAYMSGFNAMGRKA